MNTPARVVLAALCLAPALASADVYVTPFAGYSFAASSLDASKDDSLGSVSAEESSHYGIMLGTTTRHPGNMYVLYSSQSTDLKAGGAFSNQRVTSLKLDYAHVGGSLYFPKGNFLPYVTASMGLTQMRPGDDYSNETRFSLGLGTGVEYRLGDNLALIADVRAFATFIDSENDLFCDASNCIWKVNADLMWQGQANVGVSFRF
jgi:opacity protein-like surface antigen